MKRVLLCIGIMFFTISCVTATRSPIALFQNEQIPDGESIVIGRIAKNSLLDSFSNKTVLFQHVDTEKTW